MRSLPSLPMSWSPPDLDHGVRRRLASVSRMRSPPTCRLRFYAGPVGLVAAAALIAAAPAAAKPKASKQLTVRVAAPTVGDLTYATFRVTAKTPRASAASAVTAAAAAPADITATTSLARVRKNVSDITI